MSDTSPASLQFFCFTVQVDLDGLFLFSSSDRAMMPGNVSLRTVRVEQTSSTDANVLADRARDRVISMLNEEKARKIDEQRRGTPERVRRRAILHTRDSRTSLAI